MNRSQSLRPAPVRHATWFLCAGLSAALSAASPAPAQDGGEAPARPAASDERDPEAIEERAARHFDLCDLDANGWVSFREAQATLGVSKSEYRRYDTDADGRVDMSEFRARGATILARLGAGPKSDVARPRPVPRSGGPSGPPPALLAPFEEPSYPRPGDLLAVYDRNRSRGLDERELKRLNDDLGGTLSVDLIARQMDPDGSGQLELGELGPLARLVASKVPDKLRSDGRTGEPELDELYRTALPRRAPTSNAPLTPRIPGPVRHFRRLDLDDDGYIDTEDLRRLLAPARVDVRSSAVLAAIDRDGDGRVDEAEFAASLGAR